MADKRSKVLRWVLLMSALVGGVVLVRLMGWQEVVNVELLREWVDRAGAWGVVAYLGVFCAGVTLSIPGLVFISAGALIFEPQVGVPVVLVGAVAAGGLSVWVLQRLGGGAVLEEVDSDFVRGALSRLQDRSVLTVALIRLVLLLSPLANAPLAMAGVKVRHNLAGTALGILPAVLATSMGSGLLISWLGL